MELTLPYDSETEDVVLGAVIHNKNEYEAVSRYIPNVEVFYQTRAQLLWNKITKMRRDDKHVDMLTVCSSLDKKDNNKGLTSYYVTKCTSDLPAKGMAEYYANKIYEKYLSYIDE